MNAEDKMEEREGISEDRTGVREGGNKREWREEKSGENAEGKLQTEYF